MPGKSQQDFPLIRIVWPRAGQQERVIEAFNKSSCPAPPSGEATLISSPGCWGLMKVIPSMTVPGHVMHQATERGQDAEVSLEQGLHGAQLGYAQGRLSCPCPPRPQASPPALDLLSRLKCPNKDPAQSGQEAECRAETDVGWCGSSAGTRRNSETVVM